MITELRIKGQETNTKKKQYPVELYLEHYGDNVILRMTDMQKPETGFWNIAQISKKTGKLSLFISLPEGYGLCLDSHGTIVTE